MSAMRHFVAIREHQSMSAIQLHQCARKRKVQKRNVDFRTKNDVILRLSTEQMLNMII